VWSVATWILAVAIGALGASAARSAWRARELAARGVLSAHFRWHRRGWTAAVAGVIVSFAAASAAGFAAVAGVDPGQKAALLQANIDATMFAPPFVAAALAQAASGLTLFWLGWRHGHLSREHGGA